MPERIVALVALNPICECGRLQEYPAELKASMVPELDVEAAIKIREWACTGCGRSIVGRFFERQNIAI